MTSHFILRDQLIAKTSQEEVDALLDAHQEFLGVGDVPHGQFETVIGTVVPDEVEVRISGPLSPSGSQFLAIHGDYAKLARFIAGWLYTLDYHLANKSAAERLEIQRKIDAELEEEE